MVASILASILAQQQTHYEQNQALLVIDLQNDFIAQDGKLPVPLESGFLDRIRALIPQFREFAGDVIWVRSEFQGERSGNGEDQKIIIDADQYGISPFESEDAVESEEPIITPNKKKKGRKRNKAMQFLKDMGKKDSQAASEPSSPDLPEEDELFLSQTGKGPCCLPGTPGTDMIPEAVQLMRPNDLVIVKSHYSAFDQTELRMRLHMNQVTELYIVGCMTNLSVFATAQDAASCGMVINIVSDCVGYRTQKRHDRALRALTEDLGAYQTQSTELLAAFAKALEDDDIDKASNSTARIDSQHPYDLDSAFEQLSIQRPSKDTADNQDISEATNALASTTISSENRRSLKYASMIEPRRSIAMPSAPHEEDDEFRPRTLRSSKSTPDVRSRTNVRVRMRKRNNETKSAISKVSIPPKLPMPPPTLDHEDEKSVYTSTAEQIAVFEPSKDQEADTSITSRTDMVDAHPQSELNTDMVRNSTIGEIASITKPSSLTSPIKHRKAKDLSDLPALGPGDTIGEGDSSIKHNILPAGLRNERDTCQSLSEAIFQTIHDEVNWQKMYHAAGEVPRLVAVQGAIKADGSKPVYRHPSDQSPPLSPFTEHVDIVRQEAEKLVGHPLNHVLIQLYRSGNDYISEHSDKTLDIVRGSSIVNVSFGARRTMRLRTKKSSTNKSEVSIAKTSGDNEKSNIKHSSQAPERVTQRVPMPHNSIFVLGPKTNQLWLHGITQDKRMSRDRSDEELAYSSMRISLTYRNIGTFLNADETLIWGQGAKNQHQERAGRCVNAHAEETKRMIEAFGVENREAADFDWDRVYGGGFDVLNMQAVKEKVV